MISLLRFRFKANLVQHALYLHLTRCPGDRTSHVRHDDNNRLTV